MPCGKFLLSCCGSLSRVPGRRPVDRQEGYRREAVRNGRVYKTRREILDEQRERKAARENERIEKRQVKVYQAFLCVGYMEANRETIEAGKEVVRQSKRKAIYLRNRDKILARCKARYEANLEKQRERSRIYKHSHPDKVKRWQGKRTNLAAATDDGSLTRGVVCHLFTDAVMCPYCGDSIGPRSRRRKSLDHVVPLSRGGKHSIRNVVVCCWDCNLKKKDSLLEELGWRLQDDRRTRA